MQSLLKFFSLPARPVARAALPSRGAGRGRALSRLAPPARVAVPAMLLAAFLGAPQLAQAASFESPSIGLQEHLNALTAGTSPQVATPASVSAAELTALCQTLQFENGLSQAQAGQLQRAVADGDVSFAPDTITCDGATTLVEDGVFVPGVITFSFNPAQPASGATVTATATYNDPSGADRGSHSWTIADQAANAIADTEGAATGSGTTHTTTFTMPASGPATIVHMYTSGNAFATDTIATRGVILAPTNPVAPAVSAGADQRVFAGATVTLSGTVTQTGGLGLLTYLWQQVASDSVAAAVVATTATNYVGNLGTGGSGSTPLAATATFTAPAVSVAATYYFRLAGRDVDTLFALHANHDVVAVTVSPPAPPTADAGADQNTAPGAVVQLDGSASTNAAGGSGGITFAWNQTDAGGATLTTPTVTLSGANTAMPTFTTPSSGATLYFQLTVTDSGSMATATDRVVVTVDPLAPAVNAGPDQTDAIEGRTVTLSGTVGRPAGTVLLRYSWQQVVADSVTAVSVADTDSRSVGMLARASASIIEGSNAAVATFTAPAVTAATTYYFRLQGLAFDSGFDSHTTHDVVAITVNNTPTANAGPDQTGTAGTTVTLDGSASTNAAGAANSGLTYAWIQTADASSDTALMSGDPNYVALTGAATAAPTFTFTPPARATTLHFRLSVTESVTGSGISVTASDRVAVTIGPTPTVSAGSDQTVAEGATVTLMGTVTPRSGDTASTVGYSWQQTDASGMALATPTVSLASATGTIARSGDTENQAHATFDAPAQLNGGTTTYHFRLRGHSNSRFNAYDSVAITVRDSIVADAGPDQTINFGTSVTLDASASTDAAGGSDGLTYAWAQTDASGTPLVSPTVTLSDAAAAMPTFTFTVPASETVLHFLLTITETQGSQAASDRVAITIGPTPMVAAGTDQTVREGGTVTLMGTVTPRSGDAASALDYSWRQVTTDTGANRGTRVPIGDPAYVALSGADGSVARSGDTANQARATFTAPELSGDSLTLYFRLRGAAAAQFNAYDAVAITVQARPAANAGPDQRITAGNSVQLDGSGSTNAADGTSGITYAWAQTDADGNALTPPTVTLAGAATAMPTFTYTPPAAETVLHFRLTVTESRIGRSDSDRVAVTVGPIPAVNAGADQVVGESVTVTLSGTVTPASGHTGVVGYAWQQVTADSGQTAGTRIAAGAPNDVFLAQVPGSSTATFISPAQTGGGSTTYYFRLRGYAGGGIYNAYDAVAVTVHDRPRANAGADAAVFTGNSAGLDGSASANAAGQVNRGITYSWEQTDAGGGVLATPTVTLSDAAIAAPAFTFTTPADETVLHFRLTVTDTANSQTDTDRVAITIGPAPAVDAGDAQTVGSDSQVTLRGAITLSAGNTTGAIHYAWAETDAAGTVLTTTGAFSRSGPITRTAAAAYQFSVTLRAPRVTTPTTRHYRLTGIIRYGSGDNLREYYAMDSVTITIDPSRTPTADAGADRIISLGASVTLDGSGSARASVNTGGSITYAWIQTEYSDTVTELPSDNPVYVALSGADTAMPTFTYTPPASATLLHFLLTVTDSMTMLTASDRVRITIGPMPVVNAGPDQSVREGATVNLDGTLTPVAGSTLALSYAWVQVTDGAGTTVVASGDDGYVELTGAIGTPFGGLRQARATFTAPDVDADTTIHFRLEGVANSSFRARDVVAITVGDRAAGVPTANAGADQTDTDGTTITLDGSASTNAAGMSSGITYAWAQTDAGGTVLNPATVTLSGDTTAMPAFTFTPVTGERLLHFRLTVTDTATTMTDSDRVSVTLGPTPMVSAGADETVREGVLVTLMGMVTPVGGGSVGYAWAQTDASGNVLQTPAVTLSSASGSVAANLARATFTAPQQATGTRTTYHFRLRGHSDFRFNAYDSVAITVQDTPPAGNRPTANAGPDQTTTDGTTITLDGSGSAPASVNTGGSIAYAWIQTLDATATAALSSGAANYVALTGAATAAPTFTFTPPARPTVLHFRLSVTDSMTGVTESDRVAVTLGPTPAVSAGADQAVREGALVTLSGTVTRRGGDTGVVGYRWQQVTDAGGATVVGIGDPGHVALSGASSTLTMGDNAATASFTAPLQTGGGTTTYHFRLHGHSAMAYNAYDSAAITVRDSVAANAGPDQNIQSGTSVTLDGSASTNAAGGTSGITYAWAQTNAGGVALDPPTVTLSDATAASPAFTFTPPAQAMVLHFRLTVTETASMETASDRVRITVGPTPAVSAGPDQSVDEGAMVTLSGTVTGVAGDTGTVGYGWRQVTDAGGATPVGSSDPGYVALSGASGTPGAGGAATATFTAPEQTGGNAVYYFRLRGHSAFTYNAYDTVAITVRDTDPANLPTANAGPDQTTTNGNSIQLDGSASTDAAGAVNSGITYAWIQTADATATTGLASGAPGYVALSGAATATPAFTFTPPASETTLHFLLTVTDTTTMNTARDRVRVTIGPTPMVHAGPDQTTVIEGDRVTLMGTVTPRGGDTESAVGYGWRQVTTDTGASAIFTPVMNDAPNYIALSGASGLVDRGGAAINQARATFTAPALSAASATYYFRLRGHADFVYAAFDAVAITVNKPPTADAGQDRAFVTGASVSLDGSASASAGGVVNSGIAYAWAQTDSDGDALATPTVTLSGAATATPGFTAPSSAGALHFRLTVTDDANSATATDTVTITITADRAPLTMAGADQTVGEGETVTLSGSVMLVGGDTASTLSYAWVQIASAANPAPVTGGIALANDSGTPGASGAATATFTAPQIATTSAVYHFQLTGTADTRAATDIVAITVNGKPAADAGDDQRNLLSVITATLDGSASTNAAGGSGGLSYQWIQTLDADSTAALSAGDEGYLFIRDDTRASATFTTPATRRGVTLHFLLTVTDTANMETASDRVRIAVGPLPRVNAGSARTVLAGATVTLNGTIMPAAGTTADSFVYIWEQVTAAAGGAMVNFGDDGYVALSHFRGSGGTATTTFTAPTPDTASATYYFRLNGAATVGSSSYEAAHVVAITVNRLPTANAGDDVTRITSSTTVRLDGSASSGATGAVNSGIAYAWIQTADAGSDTALASGAPNYVTLSGANTATPAITYAPPAALTTLHFLLTVTDNANGETDSDRVTVTIGPTPTVRAGMDQTVVEGATVTLSGTLTSVAGVTGGLRTLGYRWLQVASDSGMSGEFTAIRSGPGHVALSDARGEFESDGTVTDYAATATFTAPDVSAASFVYYFQLRGNLAANTNYNAFDTVAITVQGRPGANAGADQQVMTGASVSLDGSASSDAAGNADSGISYAWIQTADVFSTAALASGDGNYVALTDAATATPGFTAPTAATTLYFHLTVTGNANSRTATDRVIVTVGSVPGIAAGADQTVREGMIVTLDGSVMRHSSDTTSTLSYAWAQVSADSLTASLVMSGAPGYIALTNARGSVATMGMAAHQARATFTAPDISVPAATYYFLLSGTATGTAMTDTGGVPEVVAITVHGLPTANAGPDQERRITSSSRIVLQLNALASTNAAGMVNSGITYRWIQTADAISTDALVSGDDNYVPLPQPTVALLNLAFTQPAAGTTLHFLLTVTDTANMQTASDRVAVTFSLRPGAAAFNLPAVIEGDTVTLRGSISRAAGDTSAISYEWQQVTSITDTMELTGGDDYVGALIGATGNTATATATFTAPQITAASADYYFQLTGTTAAGSSSVITTVTVNGRPTADAGADQQIRIDAARVSLDGSASTSAAGTVNSGIAYEWIQTADAASSAALAGGAPNYVALSGANTATPTFPPPSNPATLYFLLTVTDDANGVTASDRVAVTVSTGPPTVSAGSAQSVTEGAAVTLSGTVTRYSGDSVSALAYAWDQVNGDNPAADGFGAVTVGAPGHIALSGASGAPSAALETLGQSQATFTAPEQSTPFTVYYFRLTGTASEPSPSTATYSAAAIVAVTVNDVAATVLTDINEDGNLDRSDAAIMYYAYAVRGLDAASTSDADLRHLLLRGLMPRSSRGNDTMYLRALGRADAWRNMGATGGRDINGDGSLDRSDAAIMYYAYAVRGLDAASTSDADLRHLLLRGLMPRSSRGNDTMYLRALERAEALIMRNQE